MNSQILADAETPTQVIELVEYRSRHRADDHVGCLHLVSLRIDAHYPRHAAPEDGAR